MTTTTARLTFQEESFCATLDALMAFLPAYYAEVAYLRHHATFAPHRARYQALEDAGLLLCLTARADGALVGLWLAVIGEHNHAETAVCAVTDAWYLAPAYRTGWAAWRFLDAAERAAKERGAQHLLVTTTMENAIDIVYQRRGMRPIETVYYKYLGDD